MLTQAQVKELFDYDPETGDLIWRIDRGNNKTKGKIAGSTMLNGYKYVRVNNKQHYAHRIVWLHFYGAMPSRCIDHINGVRNDNRIENLREASASQNSQNQRKARSDNKTSKLLGAYPNGKRWMSRICLNKKDIYIGTYDTPEAAHKAYLAKKRELHPFGTL